MEEIPEKEFERIGKEMRAKVKKSPQSYSNFVRLGVGEKPVSQGEEIFIEFKKGESLEDFLIRLNKIYNPKVVDIFTNIGLFDDLKEGLEEAISYEKGSGEAKVKTYMILPIREYSGAEMRDIRKKQILLLEKTEET